MYKSGGIPRALILHPRTDFFFLISAWPVYYPYCPVILGRCLYSELLIAHVFSYIRKECVVPIRESDFSRYFRVSDCAPRLIFLTFGKRFVQLLKEIHQEEKKVIIRMKMPGVDNKDLNTQVENNRLRINASRKESEPDSTYLLRERNCADYEKVFTFDETIDRDSIDAVMKERVPELSFQFKKEVHPRRIEIKS